MEVGEAESHTISSLRCSDGLSGMPLAPVGATPEEPCPNPSRSTHHFKLLLLIAAIAIMRLPNMKTLKLEEFVGDIPEYIILSLVWGKDEVSLRHFQHGKRNDNGLVFSACAKTAICAHSSLKKSTKTVYPNLSQS
jgi:hypothetical protein